MSRPIELPATIYVGSLVFCHRSGDGICTCSHLETVSGRNPLAGDEIRARAERETRKNWKTIFPPEFVSEEYELKYWHFQSAVIGPDRG